MDEWKRKNERRQVTDREDGVQGERVVKRSRNLGNQGGGGVDDEWRFCWKPIARKKAVIKGLDRIFGMAQNDENFNLFGNDIIQCFYDVATVSGEPLRRRALMYVEQLAHRWKHEVMHRGWKQDTKPTPQEVIDAIIGMYCLERLGIHHQLKAEVVTFLNLSESEGGYTVKKYLQWDPFSEEPPRDLDDGQEGENTISQQRTMSNSLIHTFYANRVGVSFGAGYEQVFKWLPTLRPYKGPDQLVWQHYIDQCYLVTHIVFTLNNWGELQLDPELLPHEYYFVREHMAVQIKHRDVHLVGEFVECLRAFGAADTDPLVQKGMTFLMSSQHEDGSWDKGEETDEYTTYHATMVGVQSLLNHRYRGFGPGMEKITPILRKWYGEELAAGSSARKTKHGGGAVSADAVEVDEDDFDAKAAADTRLEGMASSMLQLERQWNPPVAKEKSLVAKQKSPAAKLGGITGPQVDKGAGVEIKSIAAVLKAIVKKDALSDADARTVTNELQKLEAASAVFTKQLLIDTGIGKVVGKLRKSANTPVAKSAKALVSSWKKLV
jgi:hypothetical protein